MFSFINGLFNKYCMVNLDSVRSYIYFPEWIKKKKYTINPKSIDNKCF